MDRFLMHVLIDYPPVEDEVEVIRLVRGEEIAAQGGADAREPAEPIPQAAALPRAPPSARSTSPRRWNATWPIS